MVDRDVQQQDSILLPGTPVRRTFSIPETDPAYRTYFNTQLQPEYILPAVFHNIEGDVVTPPQMAVDNSLNNYLRNSQRITEENSKIGRLNQFNIDQAEIPRLRQTIPDETIEYPDQLDEIFSAEFSNLMVLIREQYLPDYSRPVQETESQFYQRTLQQALGNLDGRVDTPIPLAPTITEIPTNEIITEPNLQPEIETNLESFNWPNISAIDRQPIQGTSNYMEKYGRYRQLAVSCFKLIFFFLKIIKLNFFTDFCDSNHARYL